MRWMKETLYIQRDASGVIVRIQEDKPVGYMSTYQSRLERSSRTPSSVEKDIKEYAKLKAKKKRLTIGD